MPISRKLSGGIHMKESQGSSESSAVLTSSWSRSMWIGDVQAHRFGGSQIVATVVRSVFCFKFSDMD